MKEEEIPELNVFMMCQQLNQEACRPLPAGHFQKLQTQPAPESLITALEGVTSNHF